MNNKGLSLVELVTSVAILSFSTLMVISCFYGVISIKEKTAFYRNMEYITHHIYEEMRVRGQWYDDQYQEVEAGVYEYHNLYFKVDTQESGYSSISFYSNVSDNTAQYNFWYNPVSEESVINHD